MKRKLTIAVNESHFTKARGTNKKRRGTKVEKDVTEWNDKDKKMAMENVMAKMDKKEKLEI